MISFETSTYLLAFQEKHGALEPSEKVLFKHGDVNFEDVKKLYTSEGWLGRKVRALPNALGSGIVKTIYHLAVAVIIGIPGAFFDGGKFFQAQIYKIVRDLQEALGYIVLVFNDRLGLYLIEESQFQKTCYDIVPFIRSSPNEPLEGEFMEEAGKVLAGHQKRNEKLFADTARIHLEEGNLDEAIKFLDKILNYELKNSLIVEIIKSCRSKDLLDELNAFLVETIQTYRNNGLLDEANFLLVEHIKAYKNDGLFEDALATTLLIESDNKLKDAHLLTIANDYYEGGSIKKCLAVVESMTDTFLISTFIKKVCKGYIAEGDNASADALRAKYL